MKSNLAGWEGGREDREEKKGLQLERVCMKEVPKINVSY